MAFYLEVAYSQKDEVKKLGAKWDSNRKQWFVSNPADCYKFSKWFKANTNMLVFDKLFLIVGTRECFKCRENTTVVSFAVHKHYVHRSRFKCDDRKFHSITVESGVSNQIMEYLRTKYRFYYDYSKFTDGSYNVNHCTGCNVIQGNFYLHFEPSSPFNLYNATKIQNADIHYFDLIEALEISAEKTFGVNWKPIEDKKFHKIELI